MKNSFDYKKAKRDAERMLEVIERDPQAQDSINSLGSLMFFVAIGSIVLEKFTVLEKFIPYAN